MSAYAVVFVVYCTCANLFLGCVFIHCVVGRSRSVTFAVAYIMTVTSLPFADALTIVRERRPVANPNEGFCKQLQHYVSIKNITVKI